MSHPCCYNYLFYCACHGRHSSTLHFCWTHCRQILGHREPNLSPAFLQKENPGQVSSQHEIISPTDGLREGKNRPILRQSSQPWGWQTLGLGLHWDCHGHCFASVWGLESHTCCWQDQQGRNNPCDSSSTWIFVQTLYLYPPCSCTSSAEGFGKCTKAACTGAGRLLQQAGDMLSSSLPATANECFTIYNKINSVLNLVKNSHCYSKSLKSSPSCFPESLKDSLSPTSFPCPKVLWFLLSHSPQTPLWYHRTTELCHSSMGYFVLTTGATQFLLHSA